MAKKKAGVRISKRRVKGKTKQAVTRLAASAKKSRLPAAAAIRKALGSLGTRHVDDEQAVQHMNELADALELVAKEKDRMDTKAAEAKTAKLSYELAVNTLLDRLREFTHPKSLPLFDQASAESDLKAMTEPEMPF